MEGTLLVIPQELKNTSNAFGAREKKIRSITSEMMTLVKGLGSAYEGEAASSYINTFSKLDEDMSQIGNKIQEHVADLIEMADRYETVENIAAQENSALPTNIL